MELLAGIEPANLILTKDALCRLSYNSLLSCALYRAAYVVSQGIIPCRVYRAIAGAPRPNASAQLRALRRAAYGFLYYTSA